MPKARQNHPIWSDLTPSLPADHGGGGGGFTAGGDLTGSSVSQRVIGINTMPLNVADTTPTANEVWVGDGSKLNYRQLTADDIAPGLTVTISGSGNGTFECGNTWNPSGINAAPACNSAGVTLATLNDTLANSRVVTGTANPLAAPLAAYTENGSGATVGISLTMTKNAVTKTSNSLVSTWVDRYFAGCDADNTGTAATADGNNATLVGGIDTPGALIGTLGAFNVGSTFNLAPSGAQYGYLWTLHTAGAMTFTEGGFAFPMTRVATNVAFANQFGVSHGFDLYVTNSAITVTYTVTRAS